MKTEQQQGVTYVTTYDAFIRYFNEAGIQIKHEKGDTQSYKPIADKEHLVWGRYLVRQLEGPEKSLWELDPDGQPWLVMHQNPEGLIEPHELMIAVADVELIDGNWEHMWLGINFLDLIEEYLGVNEPWQNDQEDVDKQNRGKEAMVKVLEQAIERLRTHTFTAKK